MGGVYGGRWLRMGRGGTGVLGWWGYERGLCVAILPVLSGNIFARLLRLKEERRRRKEEKKAAAAQKRSERRAAEQVGIAEGGRAGGDSRGRQNRCGDGVHVATAGGGVEVGGWDGVWGEEGRAECRAVFAPRVSASAMITHHSMPYTRISLPLTPTVLHPTLTPHPSPTHNPHPRDLTPPIAPMLVYLMVCRSKIQFKMLGISL